MLQRIQSAGAYIHLLALGIKDRDMTSLALLEDFAFEHTNQVAALILVENHHHIGAQTQNPDDTASQEEHHPSVNG